MLFLAICYPNLKQKQNPSLCQHWCLKVIVHYSAQLEPRQPSGETLPIPLPVPLKTHAASSLSLLGSITRGSWGSFLSTMPSFHWTFLQGWLGFPQIGKYLKGQVPMSHLGLKTHTHLSIHFCWLTQACKRVITHFCAWTQDSVMPQGLLLQQETDSTIVNPLKPTE